MIRVLRPNDVGEIEHLSEGFERVLITGSVREIPNSIGELVIDGGFVLGPFWRTRAPEAIEEGEAGR
ncbi:MAG: hypothetical protein Ct9H90mP24_2380 [Methanobacteriota archaeon]|nr:MAG: hypothetical protein Ct9H90mP24_2380 [Euryarchaeota archaeon]